ncbi:hypothetical protein BBJ29_005501 [Phytophthora kernoviae]|uniref:BZIP domain-containing protein n=1 Tax=Phytophthora kernoviae TaxID=325452 RepID=A0A3R7N157_9STRA|nr:hypothetical protein BBJ29_005501 [Phytophthora kernoviae]
MTTSSDLNGLPLTHTDDSMNYKLDSDALSLDGLSDHTSDVPNFHSFQHKPGDQMDDVDLTFLSEFLQQDDISKLMDLREQIRAFQEQLDALRLKHNVTRANRDIAQWEEKAIALRIKRRQAESINEQLQQALVVQTGIVRDLRSIFTASAPPSAAINMHHFLHGYTHLRKDPQSRARDLELIGSDAKMDRAMQVVLRETATIPTSLSPEILFQELDLGVEGLGKTSTAVYAFNTRDASKAFQVTCQTILTCSGVWPEYSRVVSSMKFVDVPPTKHHVRYGITQHTYRHNCTKKQVSSEARDLYYSRMTGSCGVLVWDYVDDDDLYPLKSGTLIKRNTIGALVMRPEICQDGVERMVCRSICTDMQILRDISSLSLNVAEFALLEDMMVFETIKEGATDCYLALINAMERANAATASGDGRLEPLILTTDAAMLEDHSQDLSSGTSSGLEAFDSDFLVSGEMELQTGVLEDETLKINASGVVVRACEGRGAGQVDDWDINFLSELLPSSGEFEAQSFVSKTLSGGSSPTAESSDAAETSSSTEELMERARNAPGAAAGRPKRPKKSVSTTSLSSSSSSADVEMMQIEVEEEQVVDRKARRRAQVANSARRLRCRKKYEMMTLKTEATLLEQQLDGLRLKHKQMRVNGAVAAWEVKAIVQRHKRRQAEQTNEQLRQDLFLQSGFVRNLRSMFSASMPCTIELNMRNFLHTPTHLLKDSNARVRCLEGVCTEAKLDMAKRILLEETGSITPFTTPHISCQQIDLGASSFGMTTVAVYALETKNACKTFKSVCRAVLNCSMVWPNYSLVNSSMKPVDVPPTKLNIHYRISSHEYQSDATGDQVSVETREISYYHWADGCGVLLWDYVDADDAHPQQKDTAAMRCTIGAVLVRPEICLDGVERMVCRNICTKVHTVDTPEVTPAIERFSKSRQLCARICGSLVYETIKSDAATNPQ